MRIRHDHPSDVSGFASFRCPEAVVRPTTHASHCVKRLEFPARLNECVKPCDHDFPYDYWLREVNRDHDRAEFHARRTIFGGNSEYHLSLDTERERIRGLEERLHGWSSRVAQTYQPVSAGANASPRLGQVAPAALPVHASGGIGARPVNGAMQRPGRMIDIIA